MYEFGFFVLIGSLHRWLILALFVLFCMCVCARSCSMTVMSSICHCAIAVFCAQKPAAKRVKPSKDDDDDMFDDSALSPSNGTPDDEV